MGNYSCQLGGQMFLRLVALGALADMEEPVVAAQAVSALDAVIHVERHGAHRQVQQIAVLERQEVNFVPRTRLCGMGGSLFERMASFGAEAGV